jgi:hypothetical protein
LLYATAGLGVTPPNNSIRPPSEAGRIQFPSRPSCGCLFGLHAHLGEEAAIEPHSIAAFAPIPIKLIRLMNAG